MGCRRIALGNGRMAPCWARSVCGVIVVVACVVLGIAVLALIGVIGRGNLPERFDSKVVTVQPAGDDGVRIREVVDQDFGTKNRHGYERIIPIDFGKPTDIEASSPDANADIDVTPVETGDRIRLGDPEHHLHAGSTATSSATRCPNAQLSTGKLFLDIIGDPQAGDPRDQSIRGRRHRSAARQPDVRRRATSGATGGCTLARVGNVYRAVISPLKPGQGITISGTDHRTPAGRQADRPTAPGSTTRSSTCCSRW